MLRRNVLSLLVAAALLAGVAGSYQLVSAGDGDRFFRDASAADDERLARIDEEIREEAEELRRERERIEQRERELHEDERRRHDRPQRERFEDERHERRVDPDHPRWHGRADHPRLRGRGRWHDEEPPFRPEHVEEMGRMMAMIEHMHHVCFDPETSAMIAASSLKDAAPREPAAVTEELENALKRTDSLGLRNALRMMLRDIYAHLGNRERLLVHMREMLAENDAALQAGHRGGPPHGRPPHPAATEEPRERPGDRGAGNP